MRGNLIAKRLVLDAQAHEFLCVCFCRRVVHGLFVCGYSYEDDCFSFGWWVSDPSMLLMLTARELDEREI